jgi:hypothetical protein
MRLVLQANTDPENDRVAFPQRVPFLMERCIAP